MKKITISLMILGSVLTSCGNQDWEFPDYDYTTVYFAQQTPIRTITLGDDVYDTTLDNEHKCKIYAVMGGVYSNTMDRVIDIEVDESLCDGLTYENGDAVLPMPSNYYTLASDQITIPSGSVMGGVEVQLEDAFFDDPASIETTYVIPLRMTDVQNADSILEDKDYTLYAVKYKNKWDGNWLSHGTDVIDDNGTVTTVEREEDYVESYEVRTLTTIAYMQVEYPISTVVEVYDEAGNSASETLNCTLLLTFDDEDKCTITCGTEGYTASGTGTWTYQGAEKAWGDKDRDLLELNYEVTYYYQKTSGGATVYKKYTCADALIARDRGSKFETFTPTSE
ncbi:MAG: DUF5627 domain-containing protein [Bacteroides sp.]|nr:DUF5627 domain-containing protein [Bacteroides sp.]